MRKLLLTRLASVTLTCALIVGATGFTFAEDHKDRVSTAAANIKHVSILSPRP